MLKAFVVLLSLVFIGFCAEARAADLDKSLPFVGKVMLEIVVFFPKEFDQIDQKNKDAIKQGLKSDGAQECKDGLRMPMKPMIGGWLKVGKQTIMTDTSGNFALPVLPPGTTEIPIYQQLSDTVPLAKFPVARLAHKGEKIQPFIISFRMPFGECHTGKVDHAN